MKKLCWLDWIALVLVVIGAINWGLVGIFDFDLVWYLLGTWELVAKIVYSVVGVAGIYLLVAMIMKGCCCGECKKPEEI